MRILCICIIRIIRMVCMRILCICIHCNMGIHHSRIFHTKHQHRLQHRQWVQQLARQISCHSIQGMNEVCSIRIHKCMGGSIQHSHDSQHNQDHVHIHSIHTKHRHQPQHQQLVQQWVQHLSFHIHRVHIHHMVYSIQSIHILYIHHSIPHIHHNHTMVQHWLQP